MADFRPPNAKRNKEYRYQLQNGFECVLVDRPPDHLQIECPICFCIYKNPQIINCQCGANYCLGCIKPVQAERKPCPLCNVRFSTRMPNRGLQRTINGLRIYCSSKDAGCDWEGEMGEILQHLNIDPTEEFKLSGCKFVNIKCRHCKVDFQRSFVETHEMYECMKRPYLCTHCAIYSSSFEDVTNNHVSVCPFRQVPCQNNCGETLPYKDLDQHIANNCPLEVIDCCFKYAGCEARVVRCSMKDHIDENIADHMFLQATSHYQQLTKLESQICELQQENVMLRRQVQRLQFDQKLMQECSKIVPVCFTVKRISSKMRNNMEWVSRSFYTHRFGYKFFVIVDPNGKNGKYLSVSIELEPGEYDDDLDWPFRRSIHIQLLDQDEGREHHTKIIRYEDAPIERCSKLTDGEAGFPWGISKFISHDLLDPKYLRNDSLRFKISRVE